MMFFLKAIGSPSLFALVPQVYLRKIFSNHIFIIYYCLLIKVKARVKVKVKTNKKTGKQYNFLLL